jgi:hypothetical protein
MTDPIRDSNQLAERCSLLRDRAWWGRSVAAAQPRTLSDLVATDVVSHDVACLLLSALERRIPISVIGRNAGVGKTTLLSALIAELPVRIRWIKLRGCFEPFDFVGDPSVIPADTALLLNEISPYLPEYHWGPVVARALRLSRRGFRVYATAHADAVSDFIRLLAAPPLRVPARDIASLGTIIEIDAWNDPAGHHGLRRQVMGYHALSFMDGADTIQIASLATRRNRESPLVLQPDRVEDWQGGTLPVQPSRCEDLPGRCHLACSFVA